MRPMLLEFAGLQSYREPQRLDFADLLGGGLFGIFGPTGSGKSTILDAITLALYNKVERAGGIRGIMNQSETKLWVKFSFALQSAAGEQRYRVERSYTRDKEGNVRTAQCRLADLRSEEVLADKADDVTSKVVELIGLTVDDFTRAVVLPQGKFAEFLQLTGVKRRDMLERIFGLNQYGEELNAKLKVRLDEAGRRLDGTVREQVGLGDASAEAVAAAATALAEVEAAVAEAERAGAAADSAHHEGERVWALQEERQAAEQAHAAWRELAASVAARRAELALAQRAEQVRPALGERSEAERLLGQADRGAAAAAGEWSAAVDAETTAVDAHEAARRDRAAQSPALTERRVRLEQAGQVAGAIQTLRADVEDLAAKVAKGRGLIDELDQSIAGMTAEEAAARAEQAAVMAALAGAEVSPERRQWLQQALVALSAVGQARAQALEAESKLRRREADRTAAQTGAAEAATAEAAARAEAEGQEQAVASLEAEPHDEEEAVRAGAVWLARVESAVASVATQDAHLREQRALWQDADQAARRLAAERQRAEQAETAARDALALARARKAAADAAHEAARLQDHVSALVATLAQGQPCPVCGATHHPSPGAGAAAGPADGLRAEAEAAAEALAQAQVAAETAAAATARARTEAEVAAARTQAASQALQQTETALAAARAQLPAVWTEAAPAELAAMLRSEQAAHQGREERLREWRRALEEAQRRRDERSRALARATTEVATATSALAAAQKALSDAVAESAAAAAAVAERERAFAAATGGLDEAALQAEQARIQGADQEAAGLKARLGRLGEAQERLADEVAKTRKTHQTYTQALQEREQQRAGATERLAAQQELLAALAGDRPVAEQLTLVVAELARLERAETEAAAAAATATARRTGAEAARAAAERERQVATQRAERAEAQLGEALARCGFGAAAEAEAALRTPDRTRELEAAVRTHDQEGDRLSARLTELEGKLAGRSLTPEAWAAVQSELTAARAALTDSRDQRSRAGQVLADLEAKAGRWRALEAERAALVTRQNNATDLQRLLRGNAFVEFLAEEQMQQVALEASARLGQLTRYRYALEVDSAGGFLIRDDGNGGVHRPVTTLSGGETFLSSLSLALALSAQIQLRGHYPLEFFFLDEGFGTLDPDLLNTVIDTLERLHFEQLHVGVISHVPELRSRLHRRVIVEPAEPGGHGSRLIIEHA